MWNIYIWFHTSLFEQDALGGYIIFDSNKQIALNKTIPSRVSVHNYN